MGKFHTTRILTKKLNGKPSEFRITYDQYGVLDTIQQDGAFLSSSNRNAKAIVSKADDIFNFGSVPSGFEFRGKA